MGRGSYSCHLAKVTFNSIPEVVHELGHKIQLQGRVVGRFSKQLPEIRGYQVNIFFLVFFLAGAFDV